MKFLICALVFLTLVSVPQIVFSESAINAEANVDIASIQVAELPKTTTIIDSTPISLFNEKGAVIGEMIIRKGSEVQVFGLRGDKAEIVFAGNKNRVAVDRTTILSQVAEYRLKKAEEQKALELARAAEAEKILQMKAAEQAAKRDILVLSWNWRESSSSYYEAIGEILNESGRVLNKVQVEVSTRDSSGNIVSTGTALASDADLSPGQRTTFSVLIKKVGGEKKVGLLFRRIWGDRYSHREKD